jgi:hypothetical protein
MFFHHQDRYQHGKDQGRKRDQRSNLYLEGETGERVLHDTAPIVKAAISVTAMGWDAWAIVSEDHVKHPLDAFVWRDSPHLVRYCTIKSEKLKQFEAGH